LSAAGRVCGRAKLRWNCGGFYGKIIAKCLALGRDKVHADYLYFGEMTQMGWITFDIIVLLCVLLFAGIGIWALKRKTPMHFWAGTTVNPETITDIKKYNQANAIMWFCYCIPLIFSMIVAPFSMDIAGIIAGAGVVIGLVCLFITYGKRKYTI